MSQVTLTLGSILPVEEFKSFSSDTEGEVQYQGGQRTQEKADCSAENPNSRTDAFLLGQPVLNWDICLCHEVFPSFQLPALDPLEIGSPNWLRAVLFPRCLTQRGSTPVSHYLAACLTFSLSL